MTPHAPQLSPEVAHVLDDVFKLCRIPFVTDFLFTADPVADISILTAPVQTEHAIAARITVSGTESSAQFAHVFDFACDFYFTTVPAFSVGAVTVGFCVQEPARDASHASLHQLPIGAERVQCNRFVRDDARGVFLMFADNPATGVTEVDCMSHRSTRERSRVCARFDTDTLRANLRTASGVLHPAEVTRSLSYLSVAYERRNCPICAAAGDAQCQCKLPFKRPSHPLDFRNERRNMSLHTGRYQGGSTVRLFNAMHPFIITSLSTRSIIKGSLDRNVIMRMSKYAVQHSMSKLSVNPFATIMSGAGVFLPSLATQRDISRALAVNAHANARANAHANATVDADATPDLEDVFPGAALLSDDSNMTVKHASHTIAASAGMGTSPSLTPSLGVGGLGFGLGFGLNPFALGVPSSDSSPQMMNRSVAGLNGDQRHAQRQEPLRDYLKEFVDTNTNNGKTDDANERRQHAAGSSGADGTSSGEVGEKEKKAEMRRQRNREAAAKSNIKRKIRNEALRRELAEANQRATELRAIEKRLREENVKLRSLANRNKLRVSSHLTHIQITKS